MKYLLIIITLIFSKSLISQTLDRQIFSNAGEDQESSSYSLNFTIGEPIVSYEESGSFKLTQGFQQAGLLSDEETSIKGEEIKIDYTLFPNPATDFIKLEFSNLGNNTLNIEVVNSIGQVQMQEIYFDKEKENQIIDISRLSNGHYLIRINSENNNLLKTISFIKY